MSQFQKAVSTDNVISSLRFVSVALACLMPMGCSPEAASEPVAVAVPQDRIAAFECRPGMTAREVVDALGHPDSFQPPSWFDGEKWWAKYIEGDATLTEKDVNPRYIPPADGNKNWFDKYATVFNNRPNGVTLGYGPYTVFNQQVGEIIRYRLTLEFEDGKLLSWRRSEPRQLASPQAAL